MNDLLREIDAYKAEIDAFRPLTKHELSQLKEYYRIGLTYASNAIEGNSLTESETKVVIEDGITIGGKSLKDHLEAIGHSEAYDLLFNLAKKDSISEKDILKLHTILYSHVDASKAGKYRKEQVFISGTEFIPPAPKDVPGEMKKFAAGIPDLKTSKHPVVFAALLHKELVTVHPFIDGNGRTARLLMNLALLQAGYVITIIPPILRGEYISTIRQAQIKQGYDKPFIEFIAGTVRESQRDYLRLLNALEK
jgi:Fic family protein